MKVAILSDFHIGYERFHEDAFRQAEEALNKAAGLVDVILIAGDIFDYRHPRPEVLAEAITLFRNLAKKEFSAKVVGIEGPGKNYTNVPVVAIPGTHERRAQNATDPVDLLNLAGLLVNANQSRVILEKEEKGDLERLAVYGVGGVSDERFKETLVQLNPRPMSGAFNVLIFHQSIYEMLPFNNDFVHIEDLPSGFDLYVDGHIHSRVESECHGKKLLIPGSTVLTQLKGAEQSEKGFFVYETKTDAYTFETIDSRKFFLIRIGIDEKEPDQVREEVKKEIDRILKMSSNRPIIRVEISGKVKPGFRNLDINTHGIANDYKGRAVIEMTRSIESNESEEAENLRKGILDNASIKDYGIGIFMEKLKKNKYDMGINPSKLFETLSAEGKKEEAIRDALGMLFGR